MDWVILQSLEARLDGRVALHAATPELCRVYQGWGFDRIDDDARLILNRRNNGLFHELSPAAAAAFRARFDPLR